MIKRFMMSLIIVSIVFLCLMFGRQWYDSLLVKLDQFKSVHPDGSAAESGVNPQVRPTLTLLYRNENGKKVRAVVDAEKYSQFVKQHIRSLEETKARLRDQTEKQLHNGLETVFDGMRERVDRFADWYFAYSTTYQILWEASTSATAHALSTEAVSVTDAVAHDVETYLHAHYRDIVLRPEITDPQLQRAFANVLEAAHAGYMNILRTMRADFLVFISEHTSHLDPLAPAQLELDWQSQFNKVNMADYEKGPKGAVLGGALAAGGAALGKGIASKGVAGAAGKGVLAKLGAPFVSKAVLAGGGGAAGSLGGPAGVAIGIAVGLGIDYLISEGVETMQRDDFTADVNDALDATQTEWENLLRRSLHGALDVWFEDTIQLLPRYDEN
ncbi:MAG: hypothetical protein GY862_01420 [Gammaproteobacteria bacterium]|nr:hypothetical protein [Gammaproteobacteria bacterium]